MPRHAPGSARTRLIIEEWHKQIHSYSLAEEPTIRRHLSVARGRFWAALHELSSTGHCRGISVATDIPLGFNVEEDRHVSRSPPNEHDQRSWDDPYSFRKTAKDRLGVASCIPSDPRTNARRQCLR
jgi:hypothetical protein